MFLRRIILQGPRLAVIEEDGGDESERTVRTDEYRLKRGRKERERESTTSREVEPYR